MKKISAASVFFILLLVTLSSARSAYASTAILNSAVSQLLSSVQGRSASHFAQLHHPLAGATVPCPDLLHRKWDFLPIGYVRRLKTAGLPVSSLNDGERRLLNEILPLVLSEVGLRKVESARRQDEEIHARPDLLLDERFNLDMYGYNKYEVAVFGHPDDGAYMVTLQGHHLYLTIPVKGDTVGASTPLFFGEYPKIVELRPQEEAARSLATLLQNRGATGVNATIAAGGMILRPSNASGTFSAEAVSGSIAFSQLRENEAQALDALIGTFLVNYPRAVRASYLQQIDKVKKDSPGKILFRWEGALTPGARNHFYVLIGLGAGNTPALALEQENITDAKGEHIHSLFWSADNFRGL